MIEIRRLGAGDDSVLETLATYDGPGDRDALLDDPNALMLVAFDGGAAVGFVLAYDLPRRHGDARMLLVYEVDVVESHRRRGIARALLDHLAALARERGVGGAFVLTEPDNDAANALYESHGGERSEVVMWDFAYTDE